MYRLVAVHPFSAPAALAATEDTNWFFGVEFDHAMWNESGIVRDELYVYLPVRRVGIDVLRFVPPTGTGSGGFVIADRIQTPGQVGDVQIRTRGSGDSEVRELLVSDFTGGIRVYGYE